MPSSFRVGFALLIMTTTACHAKIRYPSAIAGYSITIEDEHGRSLNGYTKDGRTYVPGQFNQRYLIRVHNHTSRRIEAVVTVDGRDVISGELGDYSEQRGYIVGAHRSLLIRGFRQSHNHVAAFRFTSPADSYSARMGTPHQVGVIGLAVFPEKRPPRIAASPRHLSPSRAMDERSPRTRSAIDGLYNDPPASVSGGLAGSRDRSRSPYRRKNNGTQNLGTRYGERRLSPIQYVSFVRDDQARPKSILAIYYDDVSGLAARGIKMPALPEVEPSPFPRQVHYAPPPP